MLLSHLLICFTGFLTFTGVQCEIGVGISSNTGAGRESTLPRSAVAFVCDVVMEFALNIHGRLVLGPSSVNSCRLLSLPLS